MIRGPQRLLAFGVILGFAGIAGCTFMPRGARALRNEAVTAGRPFAKPPGQRHLPPLHPVPTPGALVRRALVNSPDVEAAYWQWRAAIEAIAQRGTEITVPALGASVALKNGTTSTAGTMLQLANMSSAPIEWPSKPATEARAALQRAYAAGWRFRRIEFAVRRQTLDAWYALVADSALIDLLRREAGLLQELDAFVQARIETGKSPPTAALAIEDELTQVQARIDAVSAQLPADRANLNRIIGRRVRQPLTVPGTFPELSFPRHDVARVLALAARRNPALAALRRDVSAGRIDIERARMSFIPDFSLSAATSLDGITQALGGAIMFPLTRYRAIEAAIRQSRDRLRATQARLRSRRLGIAARLMSDWMMARSDTRQIHLYETVLLPRLRRLDAFARADVAQSQAAIDEPVRIARTRVQVREMLLALMLDRAQRRAGIDELIAARLASP